VLSIVWVDVVAEKELLFRVERPFGVGGGSADRTGNTVEEFVFCGYKDILSDLSEWDRS
jgi:hypothetical protein